MSALKDINENPEHAMRGNPENTSIVKVYLEEILANPEGREVKAFQRRAYSPDNKKSLFLFHSFYGFFKNGTLEHTLVFTSTPKGSEKKGNWMLDAESDIDSYYLIAEGNPWEVEYYVDKHHNPDLDLIQTTTNILNRLNKEFTFFGPASVRNLDWYHYLWLFFAPPPGFTLGSVLLASIHGDNCTSAVLETLAW